MDGDDVKAAIQALRGYLQPDAVGRIFKQFDKFTSYKRSDQPIEKFLMEFGFLHRNAEKYLFPQGGGSPDL